MNLTSRKNKYMNPSKIFDENLTDVNHELNVDATSITAFSFCSRLSAKCGKLCVFITNVYIYIC